jgi:hypothetical protein
MFIFIYVRVCVCVLTLYDANVWSNHQRGRLILPAGYYDHLLFFLYLLLFLFVFPQLPSLKFFLHHTEWPPN